MRLIRNDFNYFTHLYQNLNISRTADELGVRQSSLSKSLKNLEDELQTRLFVRSNRGLQPTVAGKNLYEKIHQVQTQWENSLEQVLNSKQKAQGKFKVECHSVLGQKILPPLITQLNKTYPEIQVDVQFSTSKQATDNVRDYKTDLGIVVNPIPYPNLVIKNLWPEFIGIWSSRKKTADILIYNPEMIDIHRSLKGFKHMRWMPIPDYTVIASMAKRGSYHAILPNPIAEANGLNLVQELNPKVQVAAVYHSSRNKTLGFTKLLETLKKCGKI